MFTAWCFVRNPDCEFIHLSFSDSLVMDNSERIRQIIKSKEFKTFWPNIEPRQSKDSKSAWGLGSSGTFVAVQSGGTVTGFGAGRLDEMSPDGFKFSGCLLIDDPLKPDDAHSDSMRRYVNRRWDETIKTRRNSQHTPTIVIMQRLHVEDFVGYIKQDKSMEWRHVILPAIMDEGLPTERALWPQKHTLDALKEIQKQNRHVFATQYQQAPYAIGGNIIKGEFFGRYDVLPDMQYRLVFADTAMKTEDRNDYSVFQHWGLGYDNRIYLIDQIRGKWEAPELKRRAVDFWQKCRHSATGELRCAMIEDKSSGTGLIQSIRAEASMPVQAIQRSRDKFSRVMDAISYIESGYVKLPAAQDWVSDFISECEAFTSDNTHAFDDQIDPMLDAIKEMLAGSLSGDALYTQSVGSNLSAVMYDGGLT